MLCVQCPAEVKFNVTKCCFDHQWEMAAWAKWIVSEAWLHLHLNMSAVMYVWAESEPPRSLMVKPDVKGGWINCKDWERRGIKRDLSHVSILVSILKIGLNCWLCLYLQLNAMTYNHSLWLWTHKLQNNPKLVLIFKKKCLPGRLWHLKNKASVTLSYCHLNKSNENTRTSIIITTAQFPE